ncbi:MAG: DUF2007 domain-containing protein [Verrucomicrobia bacterium]|nr:DUF2007 domain-containing protein [Verrucomicrobiota bacterium]
MKLVTVSRVFSPAEAQLLRSRLEAAGIPAVVTHETAALMIDGYSMAAGGVLVQVADDRVEEARELLGLPPLPPVAPEPEPPAEPPSPPLVTVFHTFVPAEAEVVRSRLTAAGIEAVVTQETAPLASLLATGGVLVQVAEDEAEAARALINPGEPDEPKA